MEITYDKTMLDGEAIRMLYTLAPVAFKLVHGYLPRENAAEKLTQEWDAANLSTALEFDAFYQSKIEMAEESTAWAAERNGQRLRRVVHAGTIAKMLGMKSFAEVGAGVGCDGIALTKLGFECKYLAEINKPSLAVMKRIADLALVDVNIVDLGTTTKEKAQKERGPVDWLYSSDVFEHIHDLEGWLGDWIKSFKVVTVYAPFGSNEEQHQHTSYSKKEFNEFMARSGFDKVRIRGLGIPPMVYFRRMKNA